jgi:hypothetical protein
LLGKKMFLMKKSDGGSTAGYRNRDCENHDLRLSGGSSLYLVASLRNNGTSKSSNSVVRENNLTEEELSGRRDPTGSDSVS